MTDETPVTEQQTEDPYADLKAEFAKQLSDLKAEMSSKVDELTKSNESLQKENSDLKRSLVRHTITSPPTESEVELTPEQKYAKKVDSLSKDCVKYMQII